MELGAFSISLSVSDLETSRAFYENLGFEVIGGELEHRYIMMRNGAAIIGLFQDVFPNTHILTFNPGLGQDTSELDSYTDVREIQARLDEADIELTDRVDPETSGAGHISLIDPDGNAILIDQFQ